MTQTLQTLLVEDDATFAQVIQRSLFQKLKIKWAKDLQTARRLLSEDTFDLVLLDKHLPDGLGTQLIPEIRMSHPRAAILVLTADRLDESVSDALASGASDYLHKTEYLSSDLLGRILVAQQRVALERRLAKAEKIASEKLKAELVGSSDSMNTLRESIAVFGPQNVGVLVTGETGTGKELVARALNRACGDLSRSFVAINCGAIPKDLIESELFGHKKGAFTGAVSDRAGRIEEANGGDLFLDEIGDLPVELQVKLLRVLDSGEYYRVGDDKIRHSSFRVIGATNKFLRDLIDQGEFREDLYFRIACAELETTPLRARSEDIPALVDHFLKLEEGSRFNVEEDAIHWMKSEPWPGNVRELENVVKRGLALAKARGSTLLTLADLQSPKSRRTQTESPTSARPGLRISSPPTASGFDRHLEAAKRDYLQKTLHHFGGNLLQTAAALGMHLSTLYRQLSELGIPYSKSSSPERKRS